MTYGLLLSLHIAAGAAALVTSSVAVARTKGSRAHVRSGRAFVVTMLIVFLTAVPMTVIKGDVFLLLIAVFTGCLVLTGWQRARNRSEAATAIDWAAAILMTSTAVAIGVWSIVLLHRGSGMGVVLVVFAAIGGALAFSDLYILRRRGYRGPLRIATHLGRMLGGTIAALTAFTVVNVRIEPAFVPGLAPTVLLTPLIAYWIRRVTRPGARAAP
jgi:hypothetical protein